MTSRLTRRALIKRAAAASVLAQLPAVSAAATGDAPSVYVYHGSPATVANEHYGARLRAWGESIRYPRAILTFTPHVRSEGVELGQVGDPYTLYSFPPRFKPIVAPRDYVPPDNTALAAQVEAVLSQHYKVSRGQHRGVNHTSWMPLFHMVPKADVPLLELPMPLVSDPELFRFGQTLAPLRRDGVMILASGTMTHNLAASNADYSEPPTWAREFDAWYVETATRRDIDGLINWRKAPAARLAHPDDGGHYRVSLIALGAAVGAGHRLPDLRYPLSGFELGHFSTRSVQFA